MCPPRLAFKSLCQPVIISLLLLVGCGQAPAPVSPSSAPSEVNPTEALAETATEAPPAAETPTSAASPTPTLEPQLITAQNAPDLKSVMSLGRGAIADIAWAPDSAALTVATTQGLWTYSAVDLQLVSHIATPAPQNQVEYSPDGKSLASGGMDGVVTLWDAATGQEIRHWQTDQQIVSALAFNADASQLAASSYAPDVDFLRTVYPTPSAVIQVWDTASGEQTHHLESSLLGAFHLIFMPDGTLLAGGETARYGDLVDANRNPVQLTGDGAFEVWDLSQDKALAVWKHGKNIMNMALMADGRLVTASGDADVDVKLWNVASGAVEKFRPFSAGFAAVVSDVDASPDGSQIIASGREYNSTIRGTCGMYGFETSGFRQTVEYEGNGLLLTFSPDSAHVAGLSSNCFQTGDSSLTLWDAKSGKIIASTPWHSSIAQPDAVPFLIPRSGNPGSVLAISPDRSTVLAAGTAWTLSDGQPKSLPAGAQLALGYSADGKRIIAGRAYGVDLWDAATFDLLEEIVVNDSVKAPHVVDNSRALLSMALSPDGSAAAMYWDGGNQKYTMLLDLENKRTPDRKFFPEGYTIRALSNTGHVLAVDRDGYGGSIQFFTFEDSWESWRSPFGDIANIDINRADDLWTFGFIQTMEFNPDGSQAVTCGSQDAAVKLWNIADSSILATQQLGKRGGTTAGASAREIPAENTCYDVAYSPDGTLIALALHDGTIRLYDASLKTEIARLTTPYPVRAVAFSRDGLMLASLAADGTVQVWEVLQ